jgi:pimeloyl-ACP methyl ester carboxylesterase
VGAGTNRIPLMFIHGAWLTSGSWETFAGYFESRGYDVSALWGKETRFDCRVGTMFGPLWWAARLKSLAAP